MNVGLIGSTGMVGGAFLELLEERSFPVTNLVPFASAASAGKKLKFRGEDLSVEVLTEEHLKDLDLIFVATGEEVSEMWSPLAAKHGVFVVDNSSAFRMTPEVPLVCPEVNGNLVTKENKIFANPNCSTIQLVVLLNALKQAGEMTSVTVASYQAVSGAGRDALQELKEQSHDPSLSPKAFPTQIAFNAIPQIGGFDDLGFSSEEQKIMKETKKILELPNLKVSAQCVRLPVENAHAESVWVEFSNPLSKNKIMESLKGQEGLKVKDSGYDTQVEVSGKDEVFVSRIRQDVDNPNKWLFWIVADNIRKGAATNAIQIAERLLK